MQFINKSHVQPPDWDDWFSVTTVDGKRRSYDYNADYRSLVNVRLARAFLLTEQNGLCAYCQKQLSVDTSSMEHIVPKSQNVALSTNYHNLVAVCKNPPRDENTNRLHCDKERRDKMVVNILMLQANQVTTVKNHPFFTAEIDGSVAVKDSLPEPLHKQLSAYVEILNLNHEMLRWNRKNILDPIIKNWSQVPHVQKQVFLKTQFDRIYNDHSIAFRQYLLMYLGKRIGLS